MSKKVKVEDINARLENVTLILQETHPGNVNLSLNIFFKIIIIIFLEFIIII